MKQLDRDCSLASLILQDCEVVRKRLRRFKVTEDSFVNDESEDGLLAYDAVMSPVYRIAEDALHLSSEFQSRYPEYPWKDIRGFRNFVAHGYREVDKRIAWKVVCGNIPELEKILRNYVAAGESEQCRCSASLSTNALGSSNTPSGCENAGE